jgi:hypothetical protein
MAFKPLPAKAPSVILNGTKPLKAILGQAERLAHLQRLVESQLQPAAREHCRVASWRDCSLLLIITDGQWATRLRYQQKRLLRQLQGFDEFTNISRILFKVQPPTIQQGATGRTIDLSKNAASTILSTAEGITDPNLRAALERLAAHAKADPVSK